MFHMKHVWEFPPVGLEVPELIEDTIHLCAKGESTPDVALMQLLVVSCSERETERALGTAIWDALEDRNAGMAERLGAVQKLWDGARDLVQSVLPKPGETALQ
jgi:hypothetical protein